MPWKKAGNRTGRSEGPPNRETEDDYSAFMQAISLSTSSSSVSKEVTSLISPMASFQSRNDNIFVAYFLFHVA